jgi:hypothetical protein
MRRGGEGRREGNGKGERGGERGGRREEGGDIQREREIQRV